MPQRKRPKRVNPRKSARRKGLAWDINRQRLAVWLTVFACLLAGAGLLNRWIIAPTPEPSATPPAAVAMIPPAPKPPLPSMAAIPPASQSAAPDLPLPEQPAWLRFAVLAPEARDRSRIAIVIDDCGLDRQRTERAIALPAAVTLSFLAYSEDLTRQTAAARHHGHELLVHVPMEPINARIDMGPNGLAIGQPREEVLRRLRWDLDRFDGYVGINNHMGSRFTADAQAMYWVLGELKLRGLMFLDSRTVGSSKGELVASIADVPYAGRDVFLDDDQKSHAVAARLKDVEAIARKKGTAIAIGHPHDATLAALSAWIEELPRSGIVLVPLTDIVKARMPPE